MNELIKIEEGDSMSDEKGRKDDNGKTQYHLLNWKHVDDDAKVLTFGARKYAPDNWKLVENPVERYRDALIRHLTAYMAGEEIDPESGLPHLAHVRVNASFLQYFSENKVTE